MTVSPEVGLTTRARLSNVAMPDSSLDVLRYANVLQQAQNEIIKLKVGVPGEGRRGLQGGRQSRPDAVWVVQVAMVSFLMMTITSGVCSCHHYQFVG